MKKKILKIVRFQVLNQSLDISSDKYVSKPLLYSSVLKHMLTLENLMCWIVMKRILLDLFTVLYRI